MRGARCVIGDALSLVSYAQDRAFQPRLPATGGSLGMAPVTWAWDLEETGPNCISLAPVSLVSPQCKESSQRCRSSQWLKSRKISLLLS
jgi:hypothetical protein